MCGSQDAGPGGSRSGCRELEQERWVAADAETLELSLKQNVRYQGVLARARGYGVSIRCGGARLHVCVHNVCLGVGV